MPEDCVRRTALQPRAESPQPPRADDDRGHRSLASKPDDCIRDVNILGYRESLGSKPEGLSQLSALPCGAAGALMNLLVYLLRCFDVDRDRRHHRINSCHGLIRQPRLPHRYHQHLARAEQLGCLANRVPRAIGAIVGDQNGRVGSGQPLSFPGRRRAAILYRISTFSRDIAYSDSPAPVAILLHVDP
jgi:hypothetical protein